MMIVGAVNVSEFIYFYAFTMILFFVVQKAIDVMTLDVCFHTALFFLHYGLAIVWASKQVLSTPLINEAAKWHQGIFSSFLNLKLLHKFLK